MSDTLSDWQEHMAWIKARLSDPRFNPARRPCLGPVCRGRRRFQSADAGNRLCPRCRAHLAELYGAFDEAS